MPKVPEYPIGGVQPASGRPVFIDNAIGDAVGGAAARISGALDDAGRSRLAEQKRLAEEKQQRDEAVQEAKFYTKVSEWENADLRRVDEDATLTGAGAKGLAVKGSEAQRKFIETTATEFGAPPDVAALWIERAYARGESHRNALASKEAAESQADRANTARATLKVMTDELVDYARYGGDETDIAATIEKHRPVIELTRPDAAKLEVALGESFKVGLYAMSDVNPSGAKDALGTDTAKKYLDAADREVMLDAFEKKRVPVEVEKWVSDISQVPGYDNQRELASKIDDPAVKEGVLKDLKELESGRKDELKRKADEVSNKYVAMFDNKSNRLPTETQLSKQLEAELPGLDNADYRHSILKLRKAAADERETAYSKTTKEPKMSEREKVMLLSDTATYVYASGYVSPAQVAADKNIPESMVMEAAKFAIENGKEPAFGEYLTQAKRDNARLFNGRKEMEGQYTNRMIEWYRTFKKENGKPPNDTETRNASTEFLKNSAQELLNPKPYGFENIHAIHPDAVSVTLKDGKTVAMYPSIGGTYTMQDGSGRKMVISAQDYWDTLRAKATGMTTPPGAK